MNKLERLAESLSHYGRTFLKEVAAGQKASVVVNRTEDNDRRRLKRGGAVWFDRKKWEWKILPTGERILEYLSEKRPQ